MDNFDLKKFLVENKLTASSRRLIEQSDDFEEEEYDEEHEAELRRGGDSKYDGYVSADMGGDPDMYEEEKVHEEEDDYVNPGNTPDQAKDREEYIEKFGEKSPGEVQEGESVSKYLSLEGAEAIMKELEKDSSKAYMEAKMSKLKEVIETLEGKCKSLEESDDAAFISSSKLKEMKSTAKKLRKYEEKMVKEYDKKYAE